MSGPLCISWMAFFETVTHTVSESPLTELNLANSFKFIAICKCGFYWPKLLLDARGCLCWYSNIYWVPAVCKTLSQCKCKTTHGSLTTWKCWFMWIRNSFHYFLHGKAWITLASYQLTFIFKQLRNKLIQKSLKNIWVTAGSVSTTPSHLHRHSVC